MSDYSLATWLYFIGTVMVVAGIAWMCAIRDEIQWWGAVATAIGVVVSVCVAIGQSLLQAQS